MTKVLAVVAGIAVALLILVAVYLTVLWLIQNEEEQVQEPDGTTPAIIVPEPSPGPQYDNAEPQIQYLPATGGESSVLVEY